MSPIQDDIKFSVPSLVAVACAVVAFFDTCLAIPLAIGAIIFGLLGAFVALSPAKRGGILSILSIFAGVIAVIVGILGLIF